MDKVCRRCQKIIQSDLKEGYCWACFSIEMSEFKTIKSYVTTHQNCTMLDVVEQTGIDYKVIERLIAHGGISLVG